MSDRRTFLSQLAVAGIAAGAAPWLSEVLAGERAALRLFIPDPDESDARRFAAARRELLIPPSIAFCNTGTWGASPREVVEAAVEGYRAVERALPEWAYRNTDDDVPGPPTTGYRPFVKFQEEIGALINAPADEIAFTQNATMGMGFLANGLDLERGDEIVTTDQEHAGGLNAWLLREKRHGIVVRQVALNGALADGPKAVVEAFARALSPRTRVVMFSHVTSVLGSKLPARELCALARERGALSVVDGAQAVGQMPVDVKAIGCDAYVTSTHKWLLAPKGTGLLYIRREAQERLWSTLVTFGFDERSAGAFRFMRFGTGSLPQLIGLRAAVRFMTRLGIDRIERWDKALTARLREGLARMPHVRLSSPAHPELSAAMTTFTVAGRSADEVQDALWKHMIRVRAEGDAGVRLSAHFYVSPSDIDRALGVVRGLR